MKLILDGKEIEEFILITKDSIISDHNFEDLIFWAKKLNEALYGYLKDIEENIE